MIKKSGALYDKNMMNPVSNLSKYSDGMKQSLNLGIYGADLGYVTMYENTGDAMEYYKRQLIPRGRYQFRLLRLSHEFWLPAQ